jgi:hypothetical protein
MVDDHDVDEEEIFDWADGSMKELAMKMDDIDKELADIAAVDNKTDSADVTASRSSDPDPADYADSRHVLVSNYDSDRNLDNLVEDSTHMGLDELKEELEAFQAAAAAEDESRKVQIAPEQSPSSQPIKSSSNVRSVDTNITATVTKLTPTTSVGIAMKTTKGVTRIVQISPTGLLKDSSLRSGFEMLRVNGTDGKNAKHFKNLISEALFEVTIEARMFVEETDELEESDEEEHQTHIEACYY